MIYLYKIIGFILIPIIKVNIQLRIKKNKEIKSRYKERYGFSNDRFNNNKKLFGYMLLVLENLNHQIILSKNITKILIY